MRQALLVSLALLAVAGSAAAQLGASMTGRIERAAAGACGAATHRLACTNVYLQSSAVDLSDLEGRTVELTGALQPNLACTTIDVTTASPAARSTSALAVFGYRLNRPITFLTQAPAGSVVSYFFGVGPGFVPLGSLGSMLVSPIGARYWTSDLSIGVAVRTITVPNNPALVGQTFYMQSSYVSLAPLGAGLLNPTCFTIQ